jgi:methyl-accepting chemotaxis protein
MRVLPLGLKSLVVALCFLMPFAVLTSRWIGAVQHQLEVSRSERQALVAVARLGELAQALHDSVLDAASAAPESPATRDGAWRARIDTAYQAVLEAAAPLRSNSEIAAGLGRLTGQHEGLEGGPTAHAEGRLVIVRRYLRAVQGLSAALADDPGPEMGLAAEAHRLEDMAFRQLPIVLDALAQMSAGGAGFASGHADASWRLLASQQWARASTELAELTETMQAVAGGDAVRAQVLARPLAQLEGVRSFLDRVGPIMVGAARDEGLGDLLPQAKAARTALGQVQTHLHQTLDEMLAGHEAHLRREITRTALLILAGLALGTYMMLAFNRVLSGGMRLLREQVLRMAQGDLTVPVPARGSDEVADAVGSLSASLARLADLFVAVKQGVAAMAHASNALTTGTDDLHHRTELAANSTAEINGHIAAFMTQLEDSGRHIDDAMGVVQALRIDAVRSHQHMQRLDERMKQLQGKSRQIGDIVELMDQIAFRTNILALNAAVEAAKAGEAGRGFAVVAQEVRSLALRNAESAQQVGLIIGSSTEDIEQCTALAGLGEQSMAETQANVQRISQIMEQTVALTRGSMDSAQLVVAEVRSMDTMSGENRVLAQQMSAATGDLAAQGRLLGEKVAEFKLG